MKNVKIGKCENVKIGRGVVRDFPTTIWYLLKSYPERVKYE